MSSFGRMATVIASTRRTPAISGGKRGEPVTHITSLLCTPLDPVDPEIVRRLNISTSHELLETYVDNDEDVAEGDQLIVNGKTYPVRSCAEWTWRRTVYRHLIVEDLKK